MSEHSQGIEILFILRIYSRSIIQCTPVLYKHAHKGNSGNSKSVHAKRLIDVHELER